MNPSYPIKRRDEERRQELLAIYLTQKRDAYRAQFEYHDFMSRLTLGIDAFYHHKDRAAAARRKADKLIAKIAKLRITGEIPDDT